MTHVTIGNNIISADIDMMLANEAFEAIDDGQFSVVNYNALIMAAVMYLDAYEHADYIKLDVDSLPWAESIGGMQ